jgi:glycosyltransferase involved in cell wall biosynthesis
MIVRDIEYIGGTERFLLSLLKRLDKKKYKISVCCIEQFGKRAISLRKYNINVFYLPVNNLCDVSRYLRLVRFVKDNKINLIHTHLFKADVVGAIVGKISGVPVISTKYCEFSQAIENNTIFERLIEKPVSERIIEPLICASSSKVLAVSLKVKEALERKGVHPYKILIVPCSHIDPKNNEIGNYKIPNLNPKGKKIIVTVARLVPEKGIEYLVEAASKVMLSKGASKDIVFVVIGDGYLRPLIERKVIKEGISDRFILLGSLEEVKDVLSVVKNADLFVLSSLTEGLPLAIQEAMALGIPIVSTNVGGISELIIDKYNGLLVPPTNPSKLANAIMYLLENPSIAKNLGKNSAKAIRNHYNINYATRQIESVYDSF